MENEQMKVISLYIVYSLFLHCRRGSDHMTGKMALSFRKFFTSRPYG